jgi:hypothetical protein
VGIFTEYSVHSGEGRPIEKLTYVYLTGFVIGSTFPGMEDQFSSETLFRGSGESLMFGLSQRIFLCCTMKFMVCLTSLEFYLTLRHVM